MNKWMNEWLKEKWIDEWLKEKWSNEWIVEDRRRKYKYIYRSMCASKAIHLFM